MNDTDQIVKIKGRFFLMTPKPASGIGAHPRLERPFPKATGAQEAPNTKTRRSEPAACASNSCGPPGVTVAGYRGGGRAPNWITLRSAAP
jgi:hypothetical protein